MGISLRGYRGRNLETTVIASQGNVIRLYQTTAGTKFGRGGKTFKRKGFVDFHGCVCGSGRMILFDAKQTGKPAGLEFHAFKPHQLEILFLFGTAGAVSGALCEYTGERLAGTAVRLNAADPPPLVSGFYWADWT